MTAADQAEKFVRHELGDDVTANLIRNRSRAYRAVGSRHRHLDEIAEFAEIHRSSAYRALKSLERAGRVAFVDGAGWVMSGDLAEVREQLDHASQRSALTSRLPAPASCSCGGRGFVDEDGIDRCMACSKPKAGSQAVMWA